jgi:hypothetical protein
MRRIRYLCNCWRNPCFLRGSPFWWYRLRCCSDICSNSSS